MRIANSNRLLWALIGLALSGQAQANSIVFSTFGPSDSFDTTASWAVHAGDRSHSVAAQFTAGSTGNLVRIDLGMRFSSSFGAGIFNAYLYNDIGGAPDAINPIFLSSGSFFGTFDALVSLPISGNVPITQGSTYWLALQPGSADAWVFWDFSLPLLLGPIDISSDDGASWFSAGTSEEIPAFRLIAAMPGVPESSSSAAIFAGSFVILVSLRRYAV